MRVLLVTSEFPPGPGGIGTHAYQLAIGLHQLGWSVTALASQDYATDEEIDSFDSAQPFLVTRLRKVGGSVFEAAYRGLKLDQCLRESRPDVLVASGSRAVIVSAMRWRGRKLPWLAVGHGTEFGFRRGWEAAAVRSAFGRATAVVCVSEFTREQMLLAGVRPRDVRVIPNGADPGRFRLLPESDARAIRMEMSLPNGPLLVTVGNVSSRKGQDVVVRALPSVLKRCPEVQYAIVGLPTLEREIRDLARKLGVADRVHLLGRIDDTRLVTILNAADVFVMTSRHTTDGDFEGYGIAVIEAALCGLPSVVTSGSGLAEAVSDGLTGICVPPEDPAETAGAILRLLEDGSLRSRMGEAARLRAEGEQTWSGRVAEYHALLAGMAVSGGTSSIARARTGSSAP